RADRAVRPDPRDARRRRHGGDPLAEGTAGERRGRRGAHGLTPSLIPVRTTREGSNMTDNTAPKHTISQICIVVRDLERSMKEYSERLGWGPWKVFEYKAPFLHHTHLRGQDAAFTMNAAETMVGGLGFELIQPTGGASIYQEFLDEHGEGV